MATTLVSLYRAYLRQIRRLPQPYLRQFFRIKAFDDVRALLPHEGVRRSKMKRVTQDLRKIKAANDGNTKAFEHILDVAYGRKGKLKWELMKPILSDPNAQVSPPIIPTVEKSRPPVYSPEMKALLLSNYSRKTKPLSAKSLAFPPILPLRAEPSSEDARMLGPLSKRREVNIRWRYFTREWQKVLPPLQLVHGEEGPQDSLSQASVRTMGMQGSGVFEDVQAVAGPLAAPRPLTRKERLGMDIRNDCNPPPHRRHPSRWLRRRYQELLGRLPVLTYSRTKCQKGKSFDKYSVSLSLNALAPSLRFDPSQFPEVESASDLEWLKLGSGKDAKGNALKG
ncbi:hypothetical protein H0H87_012347 [Tephrocybe sp. NHM501043]|nr:hypothetical protein H0H87_012347 [Tephrocybe sp. NHM501043]